MVERPGTGWQCERHSADGDDNGGGDAGGDAGGADCVADGESGVDWRSQPEGSEMM